MKWKFLMLTALFLILFFSVQPILASPEDRAEDVGVSAVLSPPEEVALNADYSLKSVIFNLGTETSSFNVVFIIKIQGSSSIALADTFAVSNLPGGVIDTVNFARIFTPAVETLYEVTSYTALGTDSDHSNDTTYATTEVHWGIVVWYGNVDSSPKSVNINSHIGVDAYIQCNDDVYLANIHLCLGAKDSYIDSLLSTTEGVWYYPFTEWDLKQFYNPQHPSQMPAGWSSQSFQGFARYAPPWDNPYLHFTVPTKVLTYAMKTVNEPTIIGDTVVALMRGFNTQQGPSNAGDSTADISYPVLELHSPLYFLGAGRVTGSVTDEFSQPIAGVEVIDLMTSKSAVTGPTGAYTINNLYPGLHDISFSHPDHRDTVVTGVSIPSNGVRTLNVQMQPLPFHDVGVTAILSPPAFVQQNTSYPLRSQVANFGTVASTFDVIFIAYALGGSTPLLADTFTVTDMPGNSLDTVTFDEELVTYLDTTYQLVSYTILAEDIDASNDTSSSSSTIFFGVSAWYGNLDVSPIPANLDERLAVDVYIQTLEDIYLSYMHLCLGTADRYIDSLLSKSEGLLYYPFTEWDIAQFSLPQQSPPNPEGWSSQSFIGYSSIGSNANPWLHFEIPTLAMTFMVKIVNDPLLVGDTVNCFGTGLHPTFGPSSASDTLITQTYPVIEVFSPVYFKAVGYIGGTVTDVMSNPIEGVYVTALGTGVEDSTDQFGEYFLDSLTIGTYDLSFSHAIYRDTIVTGVEVNLRETTIIDMVLSFPCDFIPGDINGDELVTGNDLTYLVNYLRSMGPHPPDSCYNTNAGAWLYSAADVNGDCAVTGNDPTYLVNFFRGSENHPTFCQYTPPPGLLDLLLEDNKIPIKIPQGTISMEDGR
jgi:hypothetical protein